MIIEDDQDFKKAALLYFKGFDQDFQSYEEIFLEGAFWAKNRIESQPLEENSWDEEDDDWLGES